MNPDYEEGRARIIEFIEDGSEPITAAIVDQLLVGLKLSAYLKKSLHELASELAV